MLFCSPSYHQITSYTKSDSSGQDEPVSVQECKDYMRIEGWTESEATEFTFDDTLIAELITSAREFIETAANISLLNHEMEVILTNCDRIELPFSPIDEITTVYDSNDDEIDSDLIKTVGNERKFIVTPVGWDMKVVYTTTAITDKRPLVDIKRIVAALYENRGMAMEEVVQSLSLMIASYSRKSPVA